MTAVDVVVGTAAGGQFVPTPGAYGWRSPGAAELLSDADCAALCDVLAWDAPASVVTWAAADGLRDRTPLAVATRLRDRWSS